MAQPTPWQTIVQLVQDGDPIDAATTNAPSVGMLQRTQHLKDLLSGLAASETLFLRDVPVSSATAVGQPVFLDDSAGHFEQAQVQLDTDETGTWGAPAKSSYCWGLVVSKASETLATVATAGLVRDLDLSAALAESPRTGPYFLSTRSPGQLETVRSPAAPFAAYHWVEEGLTLVMPDVSMGSVDHVHHKFQLVAQPAGIPNNPDATMKHSITTADAGAEGWLPADDSTFQGMAPAGAKFGYNLSTHPELATVFPPMPLDSYSLEVYNGGLGSLQEYDDAVIVNAHGIWWMLDDYGRAPWSVDYWTGNGGAPAPSGDPVEGPTPVYLQPLHGWDGDESVTVDLSLFLWFTKLASKTNDGVVASLTPQDGAPIVLQGCNGEPASTGHLKIALDMNLATEDELHAGYQVLKTVDGLSFKAGNVVEGVKSLSPTIQVTGSEVDENGFAQGLLQLTFLDPAVSDRELDISLVALDNAREETQDEVMYLSLPYGKQSAIRGRVEIPASGLSESANYTLTLRFWLLAGGAGTLPELNFSHRRLPRPDGSPLPLPTAEDATTTIDLTSYTLGAGQYLEVDAPAFEISSGETVYFTLGRNLVDGFNSDVGILRQKGLVRVDV